MRAKPTDPYIYPNTTVVEPLDFKWGGCREVHVFATNDDFETVVAWHRKLTPDCEQYDLDKGMLEIYFYDDNDDQIGSVLAVSTASEYATENLSSYFGSKVLDQLLASGNASVVGVRFLDEMLEPKPQT